MHDMHTAHSFSTFDASRCCVIHTDGVIQLWLLLCRLHLQQSLNLLTWGEKMGEVGGRAGEREGEKERVRERERE